MLNRRDAHQAGRTVADLADAVGFLTRIRLPGAGARGEGVVESAWAFALVGAGVGIAGAAVLVLGRAIGLPPAVAAALAVAAAVILTGALHEDGLADTFDGFGGATPDRRLAIMADSRIGTFGMSALVLSLVIRIVALAAAASVSIVAAATALIAAETVSRAIMVGLWKQFPPAKADGLAAAFGAPSTGSVVQAAATGLFAWAVAMAAGISPVGAFAAAILAIFAAYGVAMISMRAIGGRTGDTLGACQQVALAGFLVGTVVGTQL